MLRRKIRPSTGTITFDTINIYDFDKYTYINNLSYTTSSPYFFNDSIINNLKYVSKNIKQIKDVLRKLNIYNIIEELPEKFNTNVLKDKTIISSYLKFMLGFARAIISKSEILCIYEIPHDLSNDELKNIKNSIIKFSKTKTMIIFTASDLLDSICSDFINISDGCVNKNNKITNTTISN